MADTKITKRLRVKLTQQEIDAKGRALAQATEDYESTQADARASASAYGEKLKKLKVEAKRLARDISDESEERPVECVERPELRTGVMQVVRLDTGEVIDSRPLAFEERQDELPFDGEGGNKSKRKKNAQLPVATSSAEQGDA